MELENKVAIVTGATGSIGRGICGVLAQKGMRVVVADLDQNQCDAFAAQIEADNGQPLGVAVDVCSKTATLKMVQTVIDAFGQIDVLINNAGIIALGPLPELSEEDFDRVIAVNLKGAFLCAQAVSPHMIERKSGKIINISSVAAKRPAPLQSAYAASKHGLLGLTQVWCQELGEHNITVNAVCPGFVESPMWSDHLSPAYAPAFGVDPDKLLQTLAKIHMPMGRPQTSEEIGESVAYFCQADSTSGQALVVDGGHAMW